MYGSMPYMVLGMLFHILLKAYADAPTDTSQCSYPTVNYLTTNTDSTILLECPVPDKSKIQWKLLTSDATTSDGKILEGTSKSYEFFPENSKGAGIYGCFLDKCLIQKFNITVYESPYFIKKMDGFVIKPAGSMAKLNCKARGFPQPNITWYRENQSPPKREQGEIKINAWSLTMKNLMINDKGNYTCVICNIVSCINFTTTVVVLPRFHGKPILTSELKNTTVLVGANISMKCEFLSDLNFHVSWIKYLNETAVTDLKKTDSGNMKPEVYEISNIAREDEGWYACVISNSVDTTISKAYLQVLDVDLLKIMVELLKNY